MAMHEQDRAILKSLVAVAWADGHFAAEEQEMLEALIAAFDATPAEAEDFRKYAATQRTLDDLPITELSAGDRQTLLAQAVVLTFIDGQQDPKEKVLIEELAKRLRLGDDDARKIIGGAEARAKRLLTEYMGTPG